MNNVSNYSTDHIRNQLGCAAGEKGVIKSLTKMAKELIESAEHAARITVAVLVISLLIFSLTKIVDSGVYIAQYCDAIAKMAHMP